MVDATSRYRGCAGIYALNNNVDRLADDHRHAQLIADALSSCSWVQEVLEVETNIVVAILNHGYENDHFINRLKENGFSYSVWEGRIRW